MLNLCIAYSLDTMRAGNRTKSISVLVSMGLQIGNNDDGVMDTSVHEHLIVIIDYIL